MGNLAPWLRAPQGTCWGMISRCSSSQVCKAQLPHLHSPPPTGRHSPCLLLVYHCALRVYLSWRRVLCTHISITSGEMIDQGGYIFQEKSWSTHFRAMLSNIRLFCMQMATLALLLYPTDRELQTPPCAPSFYIPLCGGTDGTELTHSILAEVLLCAKYWAPTQVSGSGAFPVLLQSGHYEGFQG